MATRSNSLKFKRLTAAIAAALAAPLPSFAQQSSDASNTVLPEVRVTSPSEESDYQTERLSSPCYTEPLLDTPQSVTVVPQEVIEKRNAVSLREVLQNVTGISIQAGEGNPPAGDQFKLRGFSARDDIFVDGARDVGNFHRDPFNLEAVEVAKGPASTFIGRGSSGGSVNLVTKTPRLRRFTEAEVTLGTDQTRRLTADLNQPLGASAALRLNVLAHDAEVEDRDEVENQRWGIAPSLAFGLGKPTRLRLSYFHLSQDNVPDLGIPTIREAAFANSGFAGGVAPVDFSNFYGYTNRDYEDIDADSATAEFEHDFNDRVSVRNQLRYSRVHTDSIYSAPRIVNNTGGQINAMTQARGQGKPRDQVDELLINQTDVTLDFATGAIGHTLVTGIEVSGQSSENQRRPDVNGPITNLFNPDPNLPIAPNEQAAYNGARAEFESDSYALYAFDTMKFGERWQLSGGVRYDSVESEARGIDDSGNAPPGFETESEREDDVVSWRAGLVYKPRPSGSVYAGVGTSFEPTASSAVSSAGVVQLAGGGTGFGSVAEAGFNAPPEKTRAYEIGTKWDVLNNRLSLAAAIFRIDKTDARDVDPLTSVVTVDGAQRVDGFELSAAGSITTAWKVLAGYTFLDSEIRKSNLATTRVGQAIDNTPKHTVSLWTTYRITPPWEVGFGAQYVDERTNAPAGAGQIPVTVDDYWRLDAMASYIFNDYLRLRLNVFNLADEEYIEQLSTGQAVPGAGRTALLSANLRF